MHKARAFRAPFLWSLRQTLQHNFNAMGHPSHAHIKRNRQLGTFYVYFGRYLATSISLRLFPIAILTLVLHIVREEGCA